MTPKDDPKRWLRGTCQQSLGTQSLKWPKYKWRAGRVNCWQRSRGRWKWREKW